MNAWTQNNNNNNNKNNSNNNSNSNSNLSTNTTDFRSSAVKSGQWSKLDLLRWLYLVPFDSVLPCSVCVCVIPIPLASPGLIHVHFGNLVGLYRDGLKIISRLAKKKKTGTARKNAASTRLNTGETRDVENVRREQRVGQCQSESWKKCQKQEFSICRVRCSYPCISPWAYARVSVYTCRKTLLVWVGGTIPVDGWACWRYVQTWTFRAGPEIPTLQLKLVVKEINFCPIRP